MYLKIQFRSSVSSAKNRSDAKGSGGVTETPGTKVFDYGNDCRRVVHKELSADNTVAVSSDVTNTSE
jgi:hypothetical protein